MLDHHHLEKGTNNFQLFDPLRTIPHENWSWGDYDKNHLQNDQNDVEVQLKLLGSSDDESGIHSPPLWKNTPPPASPLLLAGGNYAGAPLSPASRRQAIMKGQRELMDMVKNIPESFYELSLKDLVEHNQSQESQEDCLLQEIKDVDEKDDQVVVVDRRMNSKRQGSKKRSNSVRGSLENNNNKGVFLKMVFPVRSKSRKKVVLNSSSSSKISPRLEGGGTGPRTVEREWWRKRSSVAARESECSGSRGSSSNSSTRERRSMLSSCMTCFQSSKSQSAE